MPSENLPDGAAPFTPIFEYMEKNGLSWHKFSKWSGLSIYKLRQYASGFKFPEPDVVDRFEKATSGDVTSDAWYAVKAGLDAARPVDIDVWSENPRVRAHTDKNTRRLPGASTKRKRRSDVKKDLPKRPRLQDDAPSIPLDEVLPMPRAIVNVSKEVLRSQSMSVSLPSYLVWMLRDQAEKGNVSVSQIVRTLLEGVVHQKTAGDPAGCLRYMQDLHLRHGDPSSAPRSGRGRPRKAVDAVVPRPAPEPPSAPAAQPPPPRKTTEKLSSELEAEIKRQEEETGVSEDELRAFIQAKRDAQL